MTEPATQPSAENRNVPNSSLWESPISWGGANRVPLASLRHVPRNAVFTRAEVTFYNQGQALPALLHIEKNASVEVHLTGLDGTPWTLRSEKRGRKTYWNLYTGASWPATDPAPPELRERFQSQLEYVVVQTLLPLEHTGRHISFMIHDDGRMEDFAKASRDDVDDD